MPILRVQHQISRRDSVAPASRFRHSRSNRQSTIHMDQLGLRIAASARYECTYAISKPSSELPLINPMTLYTIGPKNRNIPGPDPTPHLPGTVLEFFM